MKRAMWPSTAAWVLSAGVLVVSAQAEGRAARLQVTSACEGNRSIAADIYADSIVVHERRGGEDSSHVMRLTGAKRQSADSLYGLIRGLGGSLILRCPNVESVSCRFEAVAAPNRLECTNCSACSEDLDRMSLLILQRCKALLRELNLFL